MGYQTVTRNILSSVAMLLLLSVPTVGYCSDPRLNIGETTKINGEVITIDTSFLKELRKTPDRETWHKNFWEMVYLISIGYADARSIGIDLLLNVSQHQGDHRSPDAAILARALTLPDGFIDVLFKKPVVTQKAVIKYFDSHLSDYLGFQYQDIRDEILRK